MMALDTTVSSQTIGLRMVIRNNIERIRRTDIDSGLLSPTLFGIRSANIMNMKVTSTKEASHETVESISGGQIGANNFSKTGVKVGSPTIPPRMATALMPI